MRAFKRLEPGDIIDSVIVASTPHRFVSSSTGWTNEIGTSESIDLQGGWRSRSVAGISGRSYHTAHELGSNGSRDVNVKYPRVARLKVYNAHDDATVVDTDADKGQQTYRAIMRLYESKHEPLLYSSGSNRARSLFFYDSTGADVAGDYMYVFTDLTMASAFLPVDCALYDVTIEAWLNPSSMMKFSDGFVGCVIGSYDVGAGAFLHTGSFVFGLQRNCLISGLAPNVYHGASSVFSSYGTEGETPPGRWSHVAYTRDNTTHLHKLFLDGVMIDQNTLVGEASGGIGATSGSRLGWYIGGGPQGNGVDVFGGLDSRRFTGLLSRVRMWNVVRTPDEIAANIRVDVPQTSSLVMDMRCDDGPLSSVWYIDSSGTFDYSQHAGNGIIVNSDVTTRANVPLWVLNDNGGMVWNKRGSIPSGSIVAGQWVFVRSDDEVHASVRVIEVPSLMYGSSTDLTHLPASFARSSMTATVACT
jgi:hypothetical protein